MTLQVYFSSMWMLVHIINFVWDVAHHPLEFLYLKGPLLSGYGFWGGMEPSTICASATGTEARCWENGQNERHGFWHVQMQICLQRWLRSPIHQQSYRLQLLFQLCNLLLFLFHTFDCIMQRCHAHFVNNGHVAVGRSRCRCWKRRGWE